MGQIKNREIIMNDKKLIEWAKEAAADRINSHMEMQGDEHGLKFIEAENAEALLELKAALLERHLLRERVKQFEIELEQLRRPRMVPQRTINSLVYWQEKDGHNFRGALIDILAELGIKMEND